MNPLADFSLSPEGRFGFTNAATAAVVGHAPAAGYTATWAAPVRLASAPGAFVKISVAAIGGEQTSWNQPVDVYFRRIASGWQLVGIDRMPNAN